MKKIYAFDAFKFGVRTFLKNPLFLIGISLLGLLSIIASFLVLSGVVGVPIVFLLRATKGLSVSDTLTTFLLVLVIILFIVFSKMILDYFALGMKRISLDFCDTGKSSVDSLFSRFSMFITYFFVSLLYFIFSLLPGLFFALISFVTAYYLRISKFPLAVYFRKLGVHQFGLEWVAIGFVILVAFIIFFYFSLKFWFYGYFILDKNAGIIESLRKSYNVVGGVKNLLLFQLLMLFFGLSALLLRFVPGTIGHLLVLIFQLIYFFVYGFSSAYLYRKLTSS